MCEALLPVSPFRILTTACQEERGFFAESFSLDPSLVPDPKCQLRTLPCGSNTVFVQLLSGTKRRPVLLVILGVPVGVGVFLGY